MEKEDLILNLLKETRKDQKQTTKDISEMKIDVALNRQDLELHMDQTRSVKELTLTIRDEGTKRMDLIEKKLSLAYKLKAIVIVAGGVGTIVGTVYGIIKIIDYFSK